MIQNFKNSLKHTTLHSFEHFKVLSVYILAQYVSCDEDERGIMVCLHSVKAASSSVSVE